ncbi:hypothetical protein D3C72_1562920 [compost metagenome]
MVVVVAGFAQCAQLPFQRFKRHPLRMDLRDLAVQQRVDVVTVLRRVALEFAQPAHVGQAHAERAAMAHEVELDQVAIVIAAVAVGLAPGRVEQPFALVVADGFDVAAAGTGEFANAHVLWSWPANPCNHYRVSASVGQSGNACTRGGQHAGARLPQIASAPQAIRCIWCAMPHAGRRRHAASCRIP